MKTQQTELAARLEGEGWRIVERDPGAGWWAHEIWKIESTWRPVGKNLWVTFFVDPWQGEGGPAGEHVWAVSVTASPPVSREETNGWAEPIRNSWAATLERLSARVRELRDEPTGAVSPCLAGDAHRPTRMRAGFPRLKTRHLYHDANIRSVEFEDDNNLVLEVRLASYSDLPGAVVHLIFLGVRNRSEVAGALEIARRRWPNPSAGMDIVGVARAEDGRFILDLAGGPVTIEARALAET